MIKINLATKPGLKDEDVRKAISGSTNDIFAVAPSEEMTIPAGDAAINETQPEQQIEIPSLDNDMFASVEANLDRLEQTEAEEFVPRHVSLPPEKRKEEEKNEGLAKRPWHHRLLRALTYLILGMVIVGGGYWAYNRFLKPAPEVTAVNQDYNNTKLNEGVIEQVAPQSAPTPAEISPTENIQPIYQTSPEAGASSGQLVPPMTVQPSQVEDVYLAQILNSSAYCQTLSQVLDLFPTTYRLQYLKMKNDKISCLIYVGSEEEAQRIKYGVQNLAGISNLEVFYFERTAGIAAPNVQIMAILKLRSDSSIARSIYFQNDVGLAQVLWAIGKPNNLSMQPLSINEPPSAKPRLAEIRGYGSIKSISNLLRELANTNLNLSFEQISLNPGNDGTRNAGVLDFSINSVIYPQKM
jgi:hypothetical protein